MVFDGDWRLAYIVLVVHSRAFERTQRAKETLRCQTEIGSVIS